MIKYVTKPPTLMDNVPLFILKRYINDDFIQSLVAWSQKEYYDLVMKLYADGHDDLAKHVAENCTNLDFIAHTPAFQTVLKYMTQDMWTKLSKVSRNILISVNEILKEEGI